MKTDELVFQKYCSICKYMKKNKNFTERVFSSKYFDKTSDESLAQVIRDFNAPLNIQTVYNCIKRHHLQQTTALAKFENTIKLINPTAGETEHELGLDEFIHLGREKVSTGEIKINAQTYLGAIKIKAEIEKGNKDTKLELLKQMFQGASPDDTRTE